MFTCCEVRIRGRIFQQKPKREEREALKRRKEKENILFKAYNLRYYGASIFWCSAILAGS